MSAQLSLLPTVRVVVLASVESEFEEWWSRYPRKIGKGAARRAYSSARRKASADELSDGLARYRFSDDRRYVPHASTWLNGERWSDEPEPVSDPAVDPWSLRAWYDATPEARGWTFQAFEEVLSASGLPATWRGSFDVLRRWVMDGYRPDSIAEVIAAAPASHDWRPGAVHSLAFFDAMVRRRAVRWDPQRLEWRRGY